MDIFIVGGIILAFFLALYLFTKTKKGKEAFGWD